jgi:hypothetical protein
MGKVVPKVAALQVAEVWMKVSMDSPSGEKYI